MPKTPEITQIVDQAAADLTPEQKVAVIARAENWLNQLQGTAYQRLFMTLVVAALTITAVFAERNTAAAGDAAPGHQTTELQATSDPQVEEFEPNFVGRLRGNFIDASFPKFGAEKDINFQMRGFGLADLVFKLEEETYRGWIENAPEFRAFAKEFSNQEPEFALSLVNMKETSVEYRGDEYLTEVTVTFKIAYTYYKDQGLTAQTVEALVTFTTQPDSEGILGVSEYDVHILTPENVAQVTSTPVVETAPNSIRSITQQDLAAFGPEVQAQAGELLAEQLLVTATDFRKGLPPFAASVYRQHSSYTEMPEYKKAQIAELQQSVESGRRDPRFGTVQIAESGAELSIYGSVGDTPVLSLAAPEGYVFHTATQTTPSVEAANPDGTLLALNGVDIWKEGESYVSHGPDNPQRRLLFRWQAAAGAGQFAEALGAQVDPDLLFALERPSVQVLELLEGEELIGFNDGLFGVSASETGITVRQVAVDTGFTSLGTIKEGLKTVPTGSYPEQPHTTIIPFQTFQNKDVPFARILPDGVRITKVTAEQAPANMGNSNDTILTISFAGALDKKASGSATDRNTAFTGEVQIIASTGTVGTGRTAKDPTVQFSFVAPGSAQMSMAGAGQ